MNRIETTTMMYVDGARQIALGMIGKGRELYLSGAGIRLGRDNSTVEVNKRISLR